MIITIGVMFGFQSRNDLHDAIREYNKYLLKNKINELENSNKVNTLDGIRFSISF